MASLRSRKRLSCFYCGRRSHLHFEGQRSFYCSSCEATNWLDKDGDITEPPASTSSAPQTPTQYAVPRTRRADPTSPSSSPSIPASGDTLFCQTCLRNQHMLASSLAQFEWPDDPDTVEYAAREKQYYALRRDLEKRYPQMCAECEPKVDKKLREASYTAQTDHLKRMMQRTRTRQQEVKQRGILDVVDLMGQWVWHLGFALQFSWHAAVLWALFLEHYDPPEDNTRTITAMASLRRLTIHHTPVPEAFVRWAITFGMLSFLWNPRFKQTIRGFTAHILGFRQWYTYQLLILLSRFACLSITQYSDSKGMPLQAMLGGQVVVLGFVVWVYKVAAQSIRTDTTPLFQVKPKASGNMSRVPAPSPVTSRVAAPTDSNDLGGILDDILHESPSRPQQSSPASSAQALSPYQPSPARQEAPRGFFSGFGRPQPTENSLGSLSLSDPSPRRSERPVVQYDEEMDWSPSGSQHRAFSTYNPHKVKNSNPRFSDTPIEQKPGPIWYKVPAAPTNPAQRLRNPPMQPVIRESPKENKENIFQTSQKGRVDLGSNGQVSGGLSTVQFADPKFFAPESKDDPRNDLTNMFASSFSISPGPEDQEMRDQRQRQQQAARGQTSSTIDTMTPNSRIVDRSVELVMLLAALGGWVSALGTEELYGPSVALASLCGCLMVSIRLTADLLVEAQLRGQTRPTGFAVLRPSWANLGVVQILASLATMWIVWSAKDDVAAGEPVYYGMCGNVLFGIAVTHHVRHLLL